MLARKGTGVPTSLLVTVSSFCFGAELFASGSEALIASLIFGLAVKLLALLSLSVVTAKSKDVLILLWPGGHRIGVKLQKCKSKLLGAQVPIPVPHYYTGRTDCNCEYRISCYTYCVLRMRCHRLLSFVRLFDVTQSLIRG